MTTNALSLLNHAANIVHTDSIDILLDTGHTLRKNSDADEAYLILCDWYDFNDHTPINTVYPVPIIIRDFINHWIEFCSFNARIDYVIVYTIDTYTIEEIYVIYAEWQSLVLTTHKGRRVRVSNRLKRCTIEAHYYAWE